MLQTQSKLVYVPCSHEDHSGQLLSLVCTDKTCKSSKLLCPLCEYDIHTSHQTVPLKVMFQSIQEIEEKELGGINLLEIAMYLDKAHMDCIKSISKFREYINGVCGTLIQSVDGYYNSLKQQLRGYVDKQIPTHLIIDYFTSNGLFNSTEQNKMEEYLSFGQNGQASKLNIYQGVKNICVKKHDELQEKINEFEKTIDKEMETLKTSFKPTIIQAVAQAEQPVGNYAFQFSTTAKGSNITVTGNNLIAEQKGSESNGQRFIICEPIIPKTGITTFSFKIIKYTGWVGIGVCHKSIIQTAGFKFNYTNIGHGSYLISNNAYSWSHLQKELNSQHKSFDFSSGDIVQVEVNYSAQTVTWKKTQGSKTFSMKIDTTQDLYPCANLCSPGDSVEIMSNEA